MAQLPATQEWGEYIVQTFGAGLGYLMLTIGYLISILGTPRLTLVSFLIITSFHLCYCFLVWWVRASQGWRFWLALPLLVSMTAIASLFPLIDLAWDWLTFLITLSLSFSLVSARLAPGLGFILCTMMIGNLLLLDQSGHSVAHPTPLEMLSASVFVTVVSLIMRILQEQKNRAERLLRQLEESNAELTLAHKQLQEYADEVEGFAIMRERTRVAREIHDTLGHYLSILNIQLETISKLQERDPAQASVEIDEARRVAAQSMQEVRNAVAALRPASVATLSLIEAITQLAREFERSAGHIQVTLDFEVCLPVLSTDVQVALFRAAQETLTNVRKHTQASKVLMRLRYENGIVELLVMNNSSGTSTKQAKQTRSGFGLIGLRERVELLGGRVVHSHTEQGGYRVSVNVPIPAHFIIQPAQLATIENKPGEYQRSQLV